MHENFETAKKILTEGDDFAICCHVNPDGDTTGSAYALAHLLTAMGKHVKIFCENPIPAKYNYLVEGLVQTCMEPKVIVAVDSASLEQLGSVWHQFGRVDLLIDHHVSGRSYAKEAIIEPKSASTTILILKLCDFLGQPVTKPIANAIYTGLATDTGCFRYSNTNAEALHTAARLVEIGCDSYRINKLMFETKTSAEMEIFKLVLDTLEYFCGGKVAVCTVTSEMRRAAEFYEEELGEITQIPSRIENVVCGITIKEKDEGIYKISLRTSAALDASKLAAFFGGGGHIRASGCTMIGDLASVKQRLIEKVTEMLS